MPNLPQLVDPAAYRACDWNLARDPAGLDYWRNVFFTHEQFLATLIQREYPHCKADDRATFRTAYRAALTAAFESAPDRDSLTIIDLTAIRRTLCEQFNFPDPFAAIKRDENRRALALLPARLRELDALPDADRWPSLLTGLLAGNLFDLGSLKTVAEFQAGNTAFAKFLARVHEGNWHIDHRAAIARAAHDASLSTIAIFVDNAGSDIVLGVLPIARELTRAGKRVILAANTHPALNDITAAELAELLGELADPALAAALDAGTLSVIPTGTAEPLIDLTELSAGVVEALASADLIWLHGMGRAIESNFHARFTTPAIHTALLKDEQVARRIGASLFDAVCRFQPPS